MILTFPKYFKKFSCIADKCTDTCCSGWDVVIDDESLEYYKNLGGDYGEKIRRLITVDEDGDSIFVSSDGRCPFLLENGLCDMYINLGHGCLSRTCRVFPRFTNSFGLRAETGLSLSCPEAARLIFGSSESVCFETENTDGEMIPSEFDAELYFTMLNVRKTAINILQDRKFSVTERLRVFLRYSDRIQRCIDRDDYESAQSANPENLFGNQANFSESDAKQAVKDIFAVFGTMEFINPDYSHILSAVETVDMQGLQTDEILIEHLAVYFVHRYYITAVYDGEVLEKAVLAAVCTAMILRISALGKCDFSEAAQKFSKEIEHSAVNMEILKESIRNRSCFSVENLINILSEKEI